MRIDIHPDFLGQSLARKKQQTRRQRPQGDTSFIELESASRRRPGEYRRLLESIYDAVLITDLKGRIVDFNSRATAFFLCERGDLTGRDVLGLISGGDQALIAAITRNLEEHKYTLIEAHCVRLDKSTFPAEIAVNMVNLDERAQMCFFVRDISVRKRAQDALEDAVRRLEEHDRARSEFVSGVSHELRTPLTSMIYAIANLLRGVAGNLPEPVRKYVELLDGDSRRLLGTVNDILDLRKAEMKTLKLAKSRVSLGRIVRRGAEALRMQAERKSVRLDTSAVDGRWFVECDAHKMERVIINLVGNAVKFTPDEGLVEVRIDPDTGKDGQVVVSVRDTGIGIPREALEHVTDMYFTVGEQASGSGLGLAISKEIVELHGGQIGIESPPQGHEQGTRVRIHLPVIAAPTVLVVDDQPEVLELLASQFAAHGYEVLQAADGAEAIARIEADGPDVVVLDMVLPSVTGKDVILRLKKNKEWSRIPVIVITGAETDAEAARVLEAFAVPALGKPWNEAELLDRVEGAFVGAARILS